MGSSMSKLRIRIVIFEIILSIAKNVDNEARLSAVVLMTTNYQLRLTYIRQDLLKVKS